MSQNTVHCSEGKVSRSEEQVKVLREGIGFGIWDLEGPRQAKVLREGLPDSQGKVSISEERAKVWREGIGFGIWRDRGEQKC